MICCVYLLRAETYQTSAVGVVLFFEFRLSTHLVLLARNRGQGLAVNFCHCIILLFWAKYPPCPSCEETEGRD